MAKWKRTKVGSVLKDKEFDTNKKLYIKFGKDVSFKQGQCLSLESKEEQLASLKDAVANNKISGEIAEEIEERINKIPEFVSKEIILVERVD